MGFQLLLENICKLVHFFLGDEAASRILVCFMLQQVICPFQGRRRVPCLADCLLGCVGVRGQLRAGGAFRMIFAPAFGTACRSRG